MKALISFSAPLSMNYTAIASIHASEQMAQNSLQQIRYQIKKNRRRRRLWWNKLTSQERAAEDDPG